MALSLIRPARALLLVLAPLAVAAPAGAVVVQDFEGGGTAFVGQKLPSPAFNTFPQTDGADPAVLPDGSGGNFLRLKGFETRMFTTVGFARDSADAYARAVGSFDFRITCAGARSGFSGGGCADGFNVALLDTSLYGSAGHVQTAAHGLVALHEGSQAFDYDTNPAVSIRSGLTMGFLLFNNVNAVRVGNGETFMPTGAAGLDLATGLNSTPGDWLTALFEVDFEADLFTLRLSDGTSFFDVFADLDISALGLDPFNSRLAFGTRSGDAAAAFDVDNISIEFFPVTDTDGSTVVSEPAGLGLLGLGLAGLAAIWGRRPRGSTR